MEHSDIEKNNWLEKYLHHELTAKEESLVEEHLLYCDICLNELELLKKSLAITKEALLEDTISRENTPAITKTRHLLPILYKTAAILLILVAIGTLLFYVNKKPISNPEPIVNQHPGNTKQLPVSDSIPKTQVLTEKPLLAAAFKPNPMYENEIQNTYRGNTLASIQPALNTSITRGSKLTFKWEYNSSDSLTLVILNNTGDEILSKKVKTSYILKESLQPGLYYWQLQTNMELLHTGKFRVNKK